MTKVRRVMLFSMGVALMALTGVCGAGAAAPEDPAAAVTAAQVPAAGEITAAGKPSECGCEDELSCSCACAPLAGSWIASLWPKEYENDLESTGGTDATAVIGADAASKNGKPILKTFKFAPVNDKCDKFVVNAQAVARPKEVIKAFPEVTDLTEFVGIACKTDSKEVKFTAISYGVERGKEEDKTVFIAVLSGTVKLPDGWDKDGYYSIAGEKDNSYKCKCCKDSCKDTTCSCKSGDYTAPDRHGHPGKCCCCKDGCKYDDCECKSGKYGKDDGKDQGKDSGKDQGKDQGKDYGKDDGKDWGRKECEEPEKLSAELTVAYFDAKHQDENGDGFPDEDADPIVCLAFKAQFKRVQLQPQCKPWKTPTNATTVAVPL